MQTIDLDICRYQVTQSIYAKQGDVGRKFCVRLTDGGNDFIVPEGAMFSVWYSGTSGEGNYSGIGERSAFAVDGNAVTVEMIAQMLINKGGGTMCLIMHSADGGQLGMWSIPYFAEGVPGIDSKAAEQYYTALSENAAKAIDGAQRVEKAASSFEEFVHERYGVGAAGLTLDQTIDSIYSRMKDNTNKIVYITRGENVTADDAVRFSLCGGAHWMILITRTNGTFGSMFAWQYGKDKTVTMVRTMYGAGWSEWKPLVPDTKEGSWVKLWENSAPNSAFPAQKITVAYGYHRLVVQFRHSIWYGTPSYVSILNGELGIYDSPTAECGTEALRDHVARFANRINEATISFRSGMLNGVVNENAAIPIAIYGVKY